MRTIGLIGGMSWRSTAGYYRLANESVERQLGGSHSARLLLASVDFAEIVRLQDAGEWDAVGIELTRHARGLQAAGAEVVLLCSNTAHRVADTVEATLDVPLLHIADAVAEAAIAAGATTVGLLGTAFTMEQPFYRERLARHGLRVLVPPADDRAVVHRIVFDELVHGVLTDGSREVLRGIIERLVVDGAEAVVLACTELELLLTAADGAVPLLPSTRIHVETAVTFAIGSPDVGARLRGRPV
jgi:aspartate racemase